MAFFKGAKKEYEVECVAEFAAPIGEVKFHATFKKLKRSEMLKLQRGNLGEVLNSVGPDSTERLVELVEQLGNLERQEELLALAKENLVNWRDMKGESDPDIDGDDNLVPFNEETKNEAFEILEYALALAKGFMEVQVGNLRLQAKN